MMQVHRKNFDQIVSQGRQLSSLCDGQTSVKINEITHRVQQNWLSVEQRLQEIIQPAREVVETWRSFNTSYVYLLDRLGELETRWYSIQRDKFSTDIESLSDKAQVNRFFYQLFSINDVFLVFLSRIFKNDFNKSIVKSFNFINDRFNFLNIYHRSPVKNSKHNIQSLKINMVN